MGLADARCSSGKGRVLRFLVIIFVLLCGGLAARAAQGAGAGARCGDHRSRWRCANSIAAGSASPAMMAPTRSADAPLTNSELFALPSMAAGPQGARRRIRSLCRQAQGRASERDHRRRKFLRLSIVRSRPALFQRLALRAGGHRQPDGPRLCSPGQLRRDQADLPPDAAPTCAQASDSLASPRLPMTLNRRAQGQGRSCGRTPAARRSPAPRSPADGSTAGDLALDRRRRWRKN